MPVPFNILQSKKECAELHCELEVQTKTREEAGKLLKDHCGQYQTEKRNLEEQHLKTLRVSHKPSD